MTTHHPPTAVITGANSGIGEAAAVSLARQGWRVFATARSAPRGRDAVDRIRQASRSDAVELVQLDLASFVSVRSAAADLLECGDGVDVLINNAGVILSERQITEDGLETTMQVNHFGHALLTSLLLPRLLRSGDPRVINVSSDVHRRAPRMPLDDLRLEQRWGSVYPYAVSKLANVLFTRELHRRYGGERAERPLAAFAVHPGVVRTNFARDGDHTGLFGRILPFIQPLFMPPAKGAGPVVELAVRADRRERSGRYFRRHREADPSDAALNDDDARALWERSTKLTQAEWPDA